MLKRDGGFSFEMSVAQQLADASTKADFRRILRDRRRLRPHPQGQVVREDSSSFPEGQVVAVSAFQARHTEQQGLLNSWQNACLYYGLPPGQVMPALFSPTPTEPDVSLIIETTPQSLLPVLFSNGHKLPEPLWGISNYGHGMSQPYSRWPRQPEKIIQATAQEALTQVEAILVPALAIDRDGVRLGQGGGWYDRALAGLADGVPVIAAIFDEELLPGGMLPMEPHDRNVDAVVTPTQFFPLS